MNLAAARRVFICLAATGGATHALVGVLPMARDCALSGARLRVWPIPNSAPSHAFTDLVDSAVQSNLDAACAILDRAQKGQAAITRFSLERFNF